MTAIMFLVVLQLIAGIYAVLSRDAIAAALMLTFSGAWLGTGFYLLIRSRVASRARSTAPATAPITRLAGGVSGERG
jgi:heme A synthase